ncbi:MAG: hypothetical protein HYU71_05345 [Bacteroidetes bacterium]|nr:hypothetical protein [Bacteroidota bacterium]
MSNIRILLILILFASCKKAVTPPDLPFPELTIDFPCVNVKDCGAVGNGVTDDSKAFELAMDKADSLKWPVYIPIGVYKARILLSHNGLNLIGGQQPGAGLSAGSIILGKIDCNYKQNVIIQNLGIDSRGQLAPADDAALSSGTKDGTLFLGQQFKNISIIGDGYAGYKHGILCQAGTGIGIKNVIVSSFYHGIAIRSSDVTIDSVAVNYCGFTSIVIKSDRGKNILTQNVSVNNVTIKGDPRNPYNRGGEVLVVSYGDPQSQTKNVHIQNVVSNYGSEACVKVQQVQGTVNNVSIQNCFAQNQGDNSIRACYDVDGGSDITFTNCTADNSLGYGFRCTGTVRNVRVQHSIEKKSGVGAWTGSFTYLQLNGVEIIK